MSAIPINTYIAAGDNKQMVEGDLHVARDGKHVVITIERIGFMDHLLCFSARQAVQFLDQLFDVTEDALAASVGAKN